ncbi:MAG: hypothetical protein LC620_06175, partial [Halobacteriales archaeon]|nr:hypothetical protein [Halobacteriales archaeon]
AYTSLRRKRNAEFHPEIGDLVSRSRTPLMDLEVHYEGLLMGYAEAQNHNRELMDEISKWRRRGMKWLALSAAPLYAAAMVLVVVWAFLQHG